MRTAGEQQGTGVLLVDAGRVLGASIRAAQH
jgi:hypothetical protein